MTAIFVKRRATFSSAVTSALFALLQCGAVGTSRGSRNQAAAADTSGCLACSSFDQVIETRCVGVEPVDEDNWDALFIRPDGIDVPGAFGLENAGEHYVDAEDSGDGAGYGNFQIADTPEQSEADVECVVPQVFCYN